MALPFIARHPGLTKLLRVMNLTAIILLTACLSVAATGKTQKVTLSAKDAPLERLFSSIEQQTSFVFFYNNDLLRESRKVTIDVRNTELKDVLSILFREQPLDYVIKQQTVFITRKGETPKMNIPEVATINPPVEIIGKITNVQGEALGGANITLKRTGKGTVSRADGSFRLSNVEPDDILVVTFVGYQMANIKVGAQTQFNVVLKIATSELDAVQIEGYRVTSKRMSTSNIVTIRAEEIERQPVPNPLAALEGKVPGLVITPSGGYNSGPIKSKLRGETSLEIGNGYAGPLIIVDGVPLNVLSLPNSASGGWVANEKTGLNQTGLENPASGGISPTYAISPEDIESISVLKDADAVAVYGSRGGNGVILITTKRGAPGKPKLDLNISKGVQFISRYYPMLNTKEYVSMRKEAFRNSNIVPTPVNAYDILEWDTTSQYSDWQKVLWSGFGQTFNTNIAFSGGDKQTTYRLSGKYELFNEITTATGNSTRLGSSLSLNHKTRDRKLEIAATSYFSYFKNNMAGLNNSVLVPPNAPPILDMNGKLNWLGYGSGADQFLFYTMFQPYVENTTFASSSLILSYTPITGLIFSTDFGYNLNNGDNQIKRPISSLNPADNPTGSISKGYSKAHRLNVEPKVSYQRALGRGSFQASVGGSYTKGKQEGMYSTGLGYTSDLLLNILQNAPTSFTANNGGEYRYAGLWGRISYNYERKLLFNLAARRDGSSRFANGKNWGNFYSLGLGYIISEEKFVKTAFPFISFGKLRGSYGLTGSDNIGDYLYLSRWSNQQPFPNYQGNTTLRSTQLPNPNLRWQVDRKLDIGVELGLFNDHLTIQANYFKNNATNMLVNYILPVLTGFSAVTANFPANVQNSGWEFMVKGSLIKRDKVEWSLFVNAGLNSNKLASFPGIEKSSYASRYKVGQPLLIRRALHWTGVNPQNGENTFEDKDRNGLIESNISPVSEKDTYVVDMSIRCDGSFGTAFQFKGFLLNVDFNFRIQNGVKPWATNNPGGVRPQNIAREIYEGRWQKPGDQAKYSRLSALSAQSDVDLYNSDGVIVDASYIRLQNLSLSYKFSDRFLSRKNIRQFNVFIRGQNLAVITSYKGADPEIGSFGSFPFQSTLIGGISLGF